MADADFTGVTNPKRVLDRRMKEAEGDSAPDPKKGIDKGDLPTPGMSQSEFSGYPGSRKKGGPPAEMLKKRASKD